MYLRLSHLRLMLLAMLTAALILAGCGAAATPAPATSGESGSGSTTTEPTKAPEGAMAGDKMLTFSSYASDPTPRAQMEETVKDFEAATGYKVELSTVNHEDFKQAIRTYLASDTPPDVMTWFAGNRARFFIEKGLIMDISDLWEREGWTKTYPKGLQELAKGKDGKFYFVPTSYYWWAIYYRPSLFEQAGVKAPIESWDELLDACDKFNAAGIAPITIGSKAPWTLAAWFDYINMRTNGPQFHIDLTDGKVAYNSPEVKETFQHWKELLDHKCFIENPEAMEWQDAIKPMTDGKAAMYLMGAFITDSYPDELEDDLDFFRFPMINDVPIGEDAPTDGYFAASKAPHPDAAKVFLGYLGGKESQEKAARELKRLATNGDVPKEIYSESVQKGIALIEGADYVAQFYDRDTVPEMAEKGMAGFAEFMANPDSADQILENLEQERARIFAAQE